MEKDLQGGLGRDHLAITCPHVRALVSIAHVPTSRSESVVAEMSPYPMDVIVATA